MKYLPLFVFLFFMNPLFAQKEKLLDSVSFCHIKYAVPSGCMAEHEYMVRCNDYTMTWLYMTEEMMSTMPDNAIKQLQKKMLDFKKEPIACNILGTTSRGYRVSYRKDKGGTVYQVICYGIVNNQPVLIQLYLDNERKTNSDFPPFPQQIISIKE